MANNNKFFILGPSWEVTGDGFSVGTTIPSVASVTWGGDTEYTKSSPVLADDEAATIVHLFLPETFYLATDEVWACVAADTYNNVGIKQVNFNYGSDESVVVQDITQRTMADGTKVQGYWIQLDNSTTAPASYEDRTLYAEAVPRDGQPIKTRTASRTIRVLKDASEIHVVTLNAADLDLSPNTRINYTQTSPPFAPYGENLHAKLARYNADQKYDGAGSMTEHKAIEFRLTPGMYYMQGVGIFPSLDGIETDGGTKDTSGYRKIVSSTGNPQDVTIACTPTAPGNSIDPADSMRPTWATTTFRNVDPWYFKDITLDLYQSNNITVYGNESTYLAPLVFDGCIIKDTSMSYSKNPTGRQGPAITKAEADANDLSATTKIPYDQVLFRGADAAQTIDVQVYNSFINTIVAGGFTSIFNCDGAVWWDTLFQGGSMVSMGVNNFRHITSYGTNPPGSDLQTERYVTNSFGLHDGGYFNEKYYYDYATSVGDASIANGTCEIHSVVWQAEDGTFYPTWDALDTAGKAVLEVRVYLNQTPVLRPPRAGNYTDGGGTFGGYIAGTRYYDYDFFLWKSGDALTASNRQVLTKGVNSSSMTISWVDDRTWGFHPWPASGPSGTTISWADGPVTPLLGEGTDALDPLNQPYFRFINSNRYNDPNGQTEFAALGLNYWLDTMEDYYNHASNPTSPVVDTPANGLITGDFLNSIKNSGLAPGDRLCPIFWAHQDGFQTAHASTIDNTVMWDYTSVMEQQFLYQGSGPCKDMVWSNALFLDPKDENSDFLFIISDPEPMRLGFKGMTSDCYINMTTAGREANADKISLWIEGSIPTQVNGTSYSGSAEGVFDVILKDCIYGSVGTFPSTWIGKDNDVAFIDSVAVPSYGGNDGNKSWGISKYGVIEQGGTLETQLSATPPTLDLGSLLPFDIKGNPRTVNSPPAAIAATEVADSESITTLLPFNRFFIVPAGDNLDVLNDTDTATVYDPGRLLTNDGAARSYKWMSGSTVVQDGPSNTYTVVTADVGKFLSCFVTADGVTEAISFGKIGGTS